ncbi:MAG TPA: hypothetical protein VK503_05185 [Candidatus Bathyarchaeia archaeon]|nr:hypothetical protein [Candidatus Bathyarchaeia archaeon]
MKSVKIGFTLIIAAVCILSVVSVFTILSIANLPGQTATFNVSQYCSLYRKQFGVAYCPAEASTTTEMGFLDLSRLPFIGMVAISVAALLLLIGVIIMMISRHVR